jgi:hypothetical protein
MATEEQNLDVLYVLMTDLSLVDGEIDQEYYGQPKEHPMTHDMIVNKCKEIIDGFTNFNTIKMQDNLMIDVAIGIADDTPNQTDVTKYRSTRCADLWEILKLIAAKTSDENMKKSGGVQHFISVLTEKFKNNGVSAKELDDFAIKYKQQGGRKSRKSRKQRKSRKSRKQRKSRK